MAKVRDVLAEISKAPGMEKLHVYHNPYGVHRLKVFGHRQHNRVREAPRSDPPRRHAVKLKLSVVYKDGKKKLDLQFASTKAPFRCIVDAWKLDRERRQADVRGAGAEGGQAREEGLRQGRGGNRQHGQRQSALTSYESANEKLKKVMRLKAGAKIRERPSCP